MYNVCMHALVTGGAGFIGSHLVDRLLKDGHQVVVLDDFSSGKAENLSHHQDNPNLTIAKKSITDNLNDLFGKHTLDWVFHIAARPRVQESIEDPIGTNEVNITGTLNVLESAKDHGVLRFVFSSSGGAVYGDSDTLPVAEDTLPNPLSPYGLHKLVGEHYCRLYSLVYGMETVSLRYANVYGPRQDPEGAYAGVVPKFISLIQKDIAPTINGDGSQTRDFVYVEDVVEANIKAATATHEHVFGGAFNIGSGQESSINEITQGLIALSGKDLTPTHGPGLIEVRRSVLDITKAKDHLGWEPTVQLPEGLQKTFEYFSQTA